MSFRDMMLLKKFSTVLFFVLLIAACTENKIKQDDKAKYELLLRENDSLKKLLNTQDSLKKALKPITVNKQALRTGKHPITLQWISWDKPGYVKVIPIANSWYLISGTQNNENGDYLKIAGKIRRLSVKELEFEGRIETLVSSINKGKPCIKEGKQTFYGKGNRKYFRLQNMTSCEGGMVVDYIDIYPGTSSL
ncbi:hypothetical protein FYC62_01905 [Pedobacter aquae]|uniref:Lipoprotein n=1 Tax=Pedobacter aquae TaxID=2605747 RepID=A0A5C0VH76_9SPHI|nr:hypothetical protein [Pedobacter aquae]QEK50560.1 hypothetical protein FYC62_01905 [Pedobacter aquae]